MKIKDRYERDSRLYQQNLNQMIQDVSRQREAKYPKYCELIPLMAKEPGLEMKGQESGEIFKIPWEEVIHKHVRASDNVDIGDVDKVGNEFIEVREGVVRIIYTIFQNSTSITMTEAHYGSMYPVA